MEGNQQLIIIDINRLDEASNEPFSLFSRRGVQIAVAFQPTENLFSGEYRLCDFLFNDSGFQITFLCFELIHSIGKCLAEHTRLNRIDDVLNIGVDLTEFGFQNRKGGIRLSLKLKNRIGNRIENFTVVQLEHGFLNHQIFNPLFGNRFFVASLLFLCALTFVIIIPLSRTAGSALSIHGGAAFPTEQLRGKQIKVLCLVTGGGFLIFDPHLLNPIKQVLGNDSGEGIRNHDISVLVFTDVLAVTQHTAHRVKADSIALNAPNLTIIQIHAKLFDGFTSGVSFKDLKHDGSEKRVRKIVLFLVQHQTKGNRTAVTLAFQSVFRMSTHDLFRKIGGIILSHAFQHRFQNDTLRSLRDSLHSGNDFHAVLFQGILISGGIVAVTGKAVQLPDDHRVKELLCAVLNHPLKIRTLICFSGKRPVNVSPYNAVTVALGVIFAFPKLTLDGFLALIIRGITGIDYCFQVESPSFMIRKSASLTLPLAGEEGSKSISINCSISGLCFALSSRI